MRKTRLVLIPGVKSLDTIGCLLLFLACPTIAFKGQENREVDTICKAQNFKEFWVDSPWPGDTDNIGWVRGYGGGTRPGDSDEHYVCNGLSSRSAVLSSRSDDRRVQARRGVSRDNGIESRKILLDNDLRRDTRRDMIRRTDSRNFSDFRRVAPDEERKMDSRRVRENRAASRASRSLDHEIGAERRVRELDSRRVSIAKDGTDVRMRSPGQQTVTAREHVDGRRISKAPSQNAEREIRYKREGREPENRRTFLNREAAMLADWLTVRNSVVGERRDPRVSIRSHQGNKSVRRIRNLDFLGRADSRISDEHSVEKRNADSERIGERTNTKLATRSAEQEIRLEKDIGEHVYRQDSRYRVNLGMARERNVEIRVMNTRDVVDSRTDSAFPVRHTDRGNRRNIRTESKRTSLVRERTASREVERSDERYNVDGRRASTDRRDSDYGSQRRNTRSERKLQDNESHARDLTAERRTISNREVIDGRRLPLRSLNRDVQQDVRYDREVREPASSRAARYQGSANMKKILHEENRVDSLSPIRMIENHRDSRLSTQSLDRQIRTKTEAPEEERRVEQERTRRNRIDSTQNRIDNLRLAEERMINSRKERENIREFRQSGRTIKRDTRSVSQPYEDIRSAEARKIDGRRLTMERRDSRQRTRSLEREVRSEREIPKSLSLQARDGRRSLSSPAILNRVSSMDRRRTEGEKEIDNVRASRRSFSRRVGDVQRTDRVVRDELRSPERLQRSTRSLQDIRTIRQANFARETGRFERRREVERDISREGRNSDRFVRGADDRQDKHQVWGPYSNSQRFHVLYRSSEEIGHVERRIEQAERETKQGHARRAPGERETRLVESSHLTRNSRGLVGAERAEINHARDEARYQLLARRMQPDRRSTGDVRRSERLTQRADSRRENRIFADSSRTSVERETTARASRERLSSLAADAERSDDRRERENTRFLRFNHQVPAPQNRRETKQSDSRRRVETLINRDTISQTRLLREARSREDIRRFDRKMPVTRNQQETSPSDSRRRLETLRYRDTMSQTRLLREARSREDIRRFVRELPVTRNQRETSQSDSRRRVETLINRNTMSQSRILQKARSREDIRRFGRELPVSRNQQDTSQSDSRRRVDSLRNIDMATPERISLQLARAEKSHRLSGDNVKSQRSTHEREIRTGNERRSLTERESRQERREGDHQNEQRWLIPADFKAINVRDARDAEIRRISRDVALKFKFMRTFPEEARRSERQRHAEKDSSRAMDKHHGNTLTYEYIRRFAELTDKRRRMMDSQEIYAGKPNVMPSVFGQVLSNEGENSFFESPKNTLASWLTTDISRTDLNGIAETLMYGGIACFALLSNINKKVIF